MYCFKLINFIKSSLIHINPFQVGIRALNLGGFASAFLLYRLSCFSFFLRLLEVHPTYGSVTVVSSSRN